MPYRKLGYRSVSSGRLLIPTAHYLIRTLTEAGTYNFAMAEALTKSFNPRDFVKGTHRDAFLKITAQPSFSSDKDYKAYMTILYAMLAAGGFGDHRPQKPEYVSDPIMTVDEMINEALGDFIEKKLPPVEAYANGEKTSWAAFSGQVLYTVQDLATLSKKRALMLDHFQRYFGNLLYQMYDGSITYGSLGGWEKSCMAVYMYHQDEKYRVTQIGGRDLPLRFPVARDVDPLLEETMARLRSVCQVGNWTNFTRIISNQDARELVYLAAPILDNLNIVSGTSTERGPYTDLKLKVTDTLSWGAEEHMASFLQRVTYESDADLSARYVTTGWRTPIRNLDMISMPILMDYPGIELAFMATSATNDRLVASWVSNTYQRRVSDLSGANADHLLMDIASKTTSEGSVSIEKDNIEAYTWTDLSDPSMQNRRITNLYTRNDLNTISELIYYIKDGYLCSAIVNMTSHYYNNGDIGFRPALIEKMQVSKKWFDKPASDSAMTYIMGRLNLTRSDVLASNDIVNISHNAAMYQRYTGNQPDFGDEGMLNYITIRGDRPRGPTATNPIQVS